MLSGIGREEHNETDYVLRQYGQQGINVHTKGGWYTSGRGETNVTSGLHGTSGVDADHTAHPMGTSLQHSSHWVSFCAICVVLRHWGASRFQSLPPLSESFRVSSWSVIYFSEASSNHFLFLEINCETSVFWGMRELFLFPYLTMCT